MNNKQRFMKAVKKCRGNSHYLKCMKKNLRKK
jgi:hypothetical protein